MQIILILEKFKDFFACKIVLVAFQHFIISLISFKNFSPANLSQIPIIIILKAFKDFFACKLVLSANHHYPENIQRNFACKSSLAANHHYPEKFQRLFRLQKCLSRKTSISWNYSKTFSLANLSQPQLFIFLRLFKDFFACKFVLDPDHHYPENIQRLFRLQVCLVRKSSLS